MNKGILAEAERRRSIRLEKTLPIKFNLPETSDHPRQFEALSRNIGQGGIFIETEMMQEKGFTLNKDARLNLEIELLGQTQRIKPQGRIVWVGRKSRTPQKTTSGFGIEFIQISAEEKRAISLFISKEMLTQREAIEKEIPVILREQKLSDRQRRNLEILDIIRKNRLISRAEISKNTGINIVTVSNYIDTYLRRGLVFERGLDISTGGRRPELIEINPQYGYVIGVDLGYLNVPTATMQVVLTDFTSRVQAEVHQTRKDDNIEDSLPILKSLIKQVLQNSGVQREKIRGIGVGVCGIMDKFSGIVRNPLTGTTFANYVVIKKDLEDEFGLPVFIENGASCALFAEKWTGISLEVKAADDIIYICSDARCAIMIKGELYTGASKSAGQLNFVLARNNSFKSNFCWMDPSFNCVFRCELKDLKGITYSEEEINTFAIKLGAKITCLVNIFNPQVVIIGALFNKLGDAFLDTIRHTVNRWAFREGANIVRIIPTTLGEEAIALGAASLVIESAFANI